MQVLRETEKRFRFHHQARGNHHAPAVWGEIFSSKSVSPVVKKTQQATVRKRGTARADKTDKRNEGRFVHDNLFYLTCGHSSPLPPPQVTPPAGTADLVPPRTTAAHLLSWVDVRCVRSRVGRVYVVDLESQGLDLFELESLRALTACVCVSAFQAANRARGRSYPDESARRRGSTCDEKAPLMCVRADGRVGMCRCNRERNARPKKTKKVDLTGEPGQ